MFSNQKTQKNASKYFCKSCDYLTSNKYDFGRHLQTQKHLSNDHCLSAMSKKRIQSSITTYDETSSVISSLDFDDETTLEIGNEKTQKTQKKRICVCGKAYNDYSGIWRHHKKCEAYAHAHKPNTKLLNDNSKHDVDILTNLVIQVMKQNQEITKQNHDFQLEQSKQMFELLKQCNTTNNNCHNTNSNNRFNLNFFLNETCKDALNINEFVENIKISLTDLENVGNLGYVEGISKIIIQNLKQLDVTKRPIHCTDLKREIIHIKDNNVWERENQEKLVNAIQTVARKNIRTIPEWKEANPEYNDSDCKKNDLYLQIVNKSVGACDKEGNDRDYEKIIQRVAKEVTIDKL